MTTKVTKPKPTVSLDKVQKIMEARKEWFEDALLLERRVDYIYKTIFKALDTRNHEWYCADENGEEVDANHIVNMINLKSNSHRLCFEVDLSASFDYGVDKEFHQEDNSFIVDKNGKTLKLYDGFPQRWLWEDFEQELINGCQAYENKIGDQAKKKLALKQKALKKLTAEEKEVLGLT